jgi:uncharacterized protein (DUF305 family)
MLRSCLVVATLLTSPVPGLAKAMKMPGGTMDAAPAANEPASNAGYRDAMSKMSQGMAITYSGNADKDFVAGMIAHHQGAIDMARVELKYGKDPQMRKLARNIITAQEKEIVVMKTWQAKHAK